MLPPAEAYRLLRLITGAVWSVAVVGIAAWVYTTVYASGGHASVKASDCGIASGRGFIGQHSQLWKRAGYVCREAITASVS